VDVNPSVALVGHSASPDVPFHQPFLNCEFVFDKAHGFSPHDLLDASQQASSRDVLAPEMTMRRLGAGESYSDVIPRIAGRD
jgi:hypothetical protein